MAGRRGAPLLGSALPSAGVAGLARPLARPGSLEIVSARPPAVSARARSVSSRAPLTSDEPRRGGCFEHHLPGQLRLSVHSDVPGRSSQGKLSCEPADPGSPPPEPRPPPGAGIAEPPGPGASPLALPSPRSPRSQCGRRASVFLQAALVARRPRDPCAAPPRRAPRAQEPGAPGAWDPAQPLVSPRG